MVLQLGLQFSHWLYDLLLARMEFTFRIHSPEVGIFNHQLGPPTACSTACSISWRFYYKQKRWLNHHSCVFFWPTTFWTRSGVRKEEKHIPKFDLPSGYVKIAIENGHRDSGFTHWKRWFSIVFCMFTRGYMHVLQTIISHPKKFATEMAAFQGKPLVTIVLKNPLVLYVVSWSPWQFPH